MPRRNGLTLTEDLGTPEAALRAAAEFGPGYRGRRVPAEPVRRQVVMAALAHFGLEIPAYLEQEAAWVDRRAKLFEAGDYPDKGITVTPQHLEAMKARFDLPVPILIEHADSPIELGYLTAVEVEGNELFGTLALTAEADQLLERNSARSLSVGLEPDLSAIREVSLVRNPRVKSARLFHFHSSLSSDDYWRSQYQALARSKRGEEAERTVSRFVREGRLTPAQAQFAQALLTVDASVDFDGDSRPIAGLLTAMLESLPVRQNFGQSTREMEDLSTHLLMPEEAEFYRRHFPNINLDQIAARR